MWLPDATDNNSKEENSINCPMAACASEIIIWTDMDVICIYREAVHP
jgi:hypothetical protein